MKSETLDKISAERLKPISIEKNITILNLGHGKYLFKSPFPFNIIYENEIYIASSYDLNTFGYGESEDEALRDLCDCIIEYYEHVKANRNKMGPLLKRDWEFLS
ncbi:MAG: hypothetical protein JSW07_02635 [bacterium]|nr:MAG: hypothetical protein JSW07_02635 [bacterium]